MIPVPLLRGPLCASAHPDGCARRVRDDVVSVRCRPPLAGPRAVLVVGGSSGLGLATRIAAAFGAGAATVNVCAARPGTPNRPASPSWYNTAALEGELRAAGLYGRTVLGDAFGDAVKARTAALIRTELGQVDFVVYSVAAARRTDPVTGRVWRSVLKPVGRPYTAKSYDPVSGRVRPVTLPAATRDEIASTVAVMGGDDWRRWIHCLRDAGALAPAATTVAFTYVGGPLLRPSYRGGTLGRAKEDLEATALELDALLRPGGGAARAVATQATVTQASSVIPVQTLYTVLLLRVLRQFGLDESPVDQAYRLLAERLYGDRRFPTDHRGRVRLDDRELRPHVQHELAWRLRKVDTENLAELGAPLVYEARRMALYGFGVPGVDYGRDVDLVREIPGCVHVAGSFHHPHQTMRGSTTWSPASSPTSSALSATSASR